MSQEDWWDYFFFVGVMICACLYNEYLRVSQSVYDAHGDAAFEDDIRQYNREFVYNLYLVAALVIPIEPEES